MTQLIEVVISPTGETKVQTKGFAGSRCRDASKYLEEALGTKSGECFTSEYYQTQVAAQPMREGQA